MPQLRCRVEHWICVTHVADAAELVDGESVSAAPGALARLCHVGCHA
jgi:hypothetical protein